MQDAKEQRYDYSTAGYDNFLTRSIDGGGNVTLPGAENDNKRSNQVAFDRAQVSGGFPDVVKIGRTILLDGPNERIVLNDGLNDRFLMGRQDGGF